MVTVIRVISDLNHQPISNLETSGNNFIEVNLSFHMVFTEDYCTFSKYLYNIGRYVSIIVLPKIFHKILTQLHF